MTIQDKQFFVSPEKLLEGKFDKASYNHYWHFLMKTKKEDSVYSSSSVEERVKQIIQKLGKNDFTARADGGMTPAHVAILNNNEAGLKFLKNKGCLAKEIPDDFQMTPVDYAKLFHPELLSFFNDNSKVLKNVVSSEFETIFKQWQVELPKGSFTYNENTNDFGLEIQSLLFTKPSDDSKESKQRLLESGVKIDHFSQNIEACAKKFGFKCVFSTDQYCVRDHFFVLSNGQFVTFADSKNIPQAAERTESRGLYYGAKAEFLTDHSAFKGSLGSAYRHTYKSQVDLREIFKFSPSALPRLRFYLEGGNQFLATNRFGQKILLLGEDSFYIALNQMRSDQVFSEKGLDLSEAIKIFKAQLSQDFALLKSVLQEMYVQGLLKSGEGTAKGLITYKEIGQLHAFQPVKTSEKTDKNGYLEQAIHEKFYSALELDDYTIRGCVDLCAKYLAQKDMTKEIIAMSFSIPSEQLFSLPQGAYHLDVFLRPGPKGSFFVQNYAFCIQLLQEIKQNADRLGLTIRDKELLERYLETALKLDREHAPLLGLVSTMVTEAGFIAIPTPGIFYDRSSTVLNPLDPDKAETFNLNFLNAITGWSQKTNSYYYLATGAGVGDKLGGVLMRAFENFMKEYQADAEVVFIGNDPKNPNDYSEGMIWMNRPGSLLGPHCLSFEMKTASHKSS